MVYLQIFMKKIKNMVFKMLANLSEFFRAKDIAQLVQHLSCMQQTQIHLLASHLVPQVCHMVPQAF